MESEAFNLEKLNKILYLHINPLCIKGISHIKFDTFKSGWSIVYTEGSQVIISKKYYIPFSED